VVEHLDTYQDGGLNHNNPIALALWETRFLWPEKGEPDFTLSLGTGTNGLSSQINTSPVKERFYVRLFKNYMRSLDGEYVWEKFIQTIPPPFRHRYHRLNITFQGPEPQLDDVASIGQLKSQTNASLQRNATLLAAMDAIWASIFYLELEDLPIIVNGHYQCVGHLCCRLRAPPQGRKFLYAKLFETSSWFIIQGRPTPCVPALPRAFPPFKRRVQFEVDSLDECISISLRGITSKPAVISGLPSSLRRLIQSQQLRAPFGRSDHCRAEKPLPQVPKKRKAV
jgi:hypothetical protein